MVSPQHYHNSQQSLDSLNDLQENLLIQINRKPIIMVPPIRVPREAELPVHIRDLRLQTRLLPQRQDLNSSCGLRAVEVFEAGGRG